MSNFPDGMTSRDWDHVEGVVSNPEPRETVVLRCVVYLTYDGRPPEDEDDEGIEAEQSPFQAEKDIARVLNPRHPGGGWKHDGLTLAPDKIEVVDAEYMSVAESEA